MTTNTNAAQVAKNLIAVAEDQAFEAWYKQDCLVGGVNARIAARAAWNARAALTTAALPPEGWPQASAADNAIGWTLDYKFLEKVEALATIRTEYGTSMEATEQVLIAALEVLAAAPKAEPLNLKCKSTQKRLATLWGVCACWNTGRAGTCGEYPPLPTGSAWCGDDDVRDFGTGPGESALMFAPTRTQQVPLFTADQMRAYVDADRAMRAQAAPIAGLHPKTASLVQRFTAALAEKLAAAEKKYGYSDGWASPDWMGECRLQLREHLFKGDPRDVAAYCAFLWHHGASTALPSEITEDLVKEAERLFPASRPAISAGDAVFAFASMLTTLPRVVPFGSAAWATPGVELATAFNDANGLSVSQNFSDGLVFPKVDGDLLAVVEKAAAPQPAAPARNDDEHPAAKRMREQFEAEYGQNHPIASAIRRYYLTHKEYDEAWNGDREKPVTLEDVNAAEAGVFAAAALVYAPQPAVQQGDGPTMDDAIAAGDGTLHGATVHPAAPVAQGDAREETNIGKAVNRAARDLPEGWEIRIDLERHAGVVHLIDPEGNETMIEGGGELFSDQISTAIDAARSQAKEGA